jgi:hypothetical protein
MRSVDFFGLSRAAQDHFVDATNGTQPPAPVLVIRGGPRGHRLGWLIALLGIALAVVLFQRGFGDVMQGSVVHGLPLIGAWVFVFVLIFGGLLHALAGERAISALPWKAGIYAFPTATVDARRDTLRIYEVDELERIDGDGGAVRLVYKGATFAFSADPNVASRARADIEEARNQGPTSDAKARASRDPLAEPRVSSPLAPTEARKPAAPGWVRLRFIYAIAIALVVGPAIWFVRNKVSDDRAFASAKAKNDVDSYRAYLKNGAKHRDEVSKTLLPRAELKIAESKKSVDAILEYQKAHSGSAIQKEVDASLRTALLAELEVAKKEGTLAALQDFAKKRPNHGLDSELKAATHTVYQNALTAFKTVANDKDPQIVAFFERLLAWAEAHSESKVEIRFRMQPSTSLPRADKYVTKQPLFNGETSYPTQYFTAAKIAAAEAELSKQLIEKLSASFPKEILTFSVGTPLPSEGDTLPAITVPTFFIQHREEWVGTAYPSKAPRGIYVGLNYHFDGQLTIPADQKPWKHHAMIIKNVPVGVLKDLKVAAPGEAEKAVYETMNKEAFDAFGQKVLAAVYKKK